MARKAARAGAAALVALALLLRLGPSDGAPAEVAVTIDLVPAGTLATSLGTQVVWPEGLDAASAERLPELGARVVRVVATSTAPPGTPPVLPAGRTRGDWDMRELDRLVAAAGRAGTVLLTVAHAPEWMWDCDRGVVRDATFAELAAYVARLVSYFSAGSFVAEDGTTVVNPAGTARRVTHWELWNEPDQPSTICSPSGHTNLEPERYVAMWDAVAGAMLAVDPGLRLLGPATANAVTGRSPDYVPALIAGAAHRPYAVSVHGYGGWLTSHTDAFLFDGEPGCCGLAGIVRGAERVRAWAPGVPIWLTETNVHSAFDATDPTGRPWGAFGAAWGASAFRRLALAGVEVVLHYSFVHPALRQFRAVEGGSPLLPYWRDHWIARSFPPGSTILGATSTAEGVEALAARAPGSPDVRVLVIARVLDPAMPAGGGLPVTVRVSVPGLAEPGAVTVRVLDGSTPLATGPAAVALAPGNEAAVDFSGYGAALIEFAAASPPGDTGAAPRSPTSRAAMAAR